MPVTTNYENGKCFARYGKEGHKYFYECGNESAKETAKKKATEQGQAIIISEGPIKYVELKKWRSDVTSSNVDKVLYNDETMELVIKFNDGSIYTYYSVPFQVFTSLIKPLALAKTEGENEYGSWYVGKPSVGAGVHQYLEGYDYKNEGTLR